MITFKQFLDEVKRTPERALKLINNIADRYDNHDEMEFPHWEDKGDPDPKYHAEKHMFDDMGVQKIKIADVIPGQQSHSHVGIKYYLTGKGNIKNPVVGILHSDGKIRLQDGHHRYMTHRLLGKKHINVRLYKTNEHYKDDTD